MQLRNILRRITGEGPGGYCVCPNCKTEIPHVSRTPCMQINCPNCGKKMYRKS